jgi:hypothetical protein
MKIIFSVDNARLLLGELIIDIITINNLMLKI